MRRILLIVAMLLLATPVLATITVSAVHKGSGVVEVSYTCSESEAVRAFALNLSITNGFTIDAIRDFNVGDNNGYGIFPGKFRDVISAGSPNWIDPNYNPVAPAGDRDALPGLKTVGGITVEMGALYAATAPKSSGKLFTIDCNNHGGVSGNLTIAANTTRGGPAVLNDGTTEEVTFNNPTTVQVIFVPAAPASISYPNYDPDCNVPIWWKVSPGAATYELQRKSSIAAYATIATVPSTDINCGAVDCNWGDMKLNANTAYHYQVRACTLAGCSTYVTREYDCNAFNSLCYPLTKPGGASDPNYGQWRNLGKPDCWCSYRPVLATARGRGYQCDGDTAGDDSAYPDYYRVYTTDLQVLGAQWKKTRPAVTSDPNATGVGNFRQMAACADIDHKDTGYPDYYRVYTIDLQVLGGNWKKHNSSWTAADKLLGNCPRQ
jgi:hypothetical protein